MNYEQKKFVENLVRDDSWANNKPIICLNIPDEFEYMNSALQNIILNEYNDYLREHPDEENCNHEWSAFYDRMGDESPKGRRCSKCNKQEWF